MKRHPPRVSVGSQITFAGKPVHADVVHAVLESYRFPGSIFGHIETPQPSDDDQMFPYDGLVHALHDDFVAFGIV